ncbi:MAG: hypothetical protein KDJ69_13345 [Nitratireductor sp.]|nr:hypothetical protein [Nitratireductor sp.]
MTTEPVRGVFGMLRFLIISTGLLLVWLIIVATITRLAEPSDAVLAWFPGGFDPVHLEDSARILSANGSLATLTSQEGSGWVAGIYRSGAMVVLPVRRRSCLALSQD